MKLGRGGGGVLSAVITARVAKRAKVMFSQVFCHSVTEWGGGGGR